MRTEETNSLHPFCSGIGAPPVPRPLHIRKCLDQLAWDIGRNDRRAGLPPFIRSRNYCRDERTWYRRGYVAQCRDQPAIVDCQNAKAIHGEKGSTK